MRTLLTLAFAVLLTCIAPSAHAGARDPGSSWDTVHIEVVNGIGYAWGQLGAVRNSPDSTEFIGCGVSGTRGLGNQLICNARDAQGHNANCRSSDPALIQALAAASSNATLYFTWDASGCASLDVEVSSLNGLILP
jgi:hypothetical protein